MPMGLPIGDGKKGNDTAACPREETAAGRRDDTAAAVTHSLPGLLTFAGPARVPLPQPGVSIQAQLES
jgi:hypothetical protein